MLCRGEVFLRAASLPLRGEQLQQRGFAQTILLSVGAPAWAYFRQLSGKEFFAAATTNYKEEVLFAINYRTDIMTAHVVRYKGVLYDITRVGTFEGYKEDLTLYCARRARHRKFTSRLIKNILKFSTDCDILYNVILCAARGYSFDIQL